MFWVGFSESLSQELAPLGIWVLIASPGGMRTNLLEPSKTTTPVIPEAYRGTLVDLVLKAVLQTHGKQDLDPAKAAEAIITEVTSGASSLLKLPLGRESLTRMKERSQEFLQNASQSEQDALQCDFPSPE
jgi:NAD(P)-dependent dehydrogenase (short-subunit alcohol dehydrogenase family)